MVVSPLDTSTDALGGLVEALSTGAVEIVDLTAPLSERTPVIQLPPERGQPWSFAREVATRYEGPEPTAYWSNIEMSEHTGTHFDAPVHWSSGRHLHDVSKVPLERLVAPAVVLDFEDAAARDPDFLLERSHVEAWQEEHGPLPAGGWLLYRTGWDARQGDSAAFLNGGRTPGVAPDCAKWLAIDTPIVGLGVETVGTDAGAAGSFQGCPYPCHWHLHGAGKYGLTQLRNLDRLPTRGAVLIVAPLPIVDGSGSPSRILALVERSSGEGSRGASALRPVETVGARASGCP